MPEAAASSPVDESAKDEMPTMGFLDHLEELRKRLIYSIVAIVVGFFACWGYAENIYASMQRPIMEALHSNGLSAKLVYLNPTEPFNLYLKVGFMAGLFVASPFVLYQLWCFISPGLYRNEKRYVTPFMVSTVALFLAGGYFGYKLVLPQALLVLIGYVIDDHRQLGRNFRNVDVDIFSSAHGHRQRRMDVAQTPIFDARHLHHRRHHH